MKNLIILLVCLSFSVGVTAQAQTKVVSKETNAINEKIKIAIEDWRQHPSNDFPDIEAIIKNEIAPAQNQKIEFPDIKALLDEKFAAAFNPKEKTKGVSEETAAIRRKIDLAIGVWKKNPSSDYPDIGAIIQREISESIARKLVN